MADTYLNNLLGEILVEALLTIAIIVLITMLFGLLPNPLVLFGYLLLILPLGSMWRDYLIWSNRKFIVSTRRVIQISGVFSKNVTDSSLEKVNDVKMGQSFLGRLLDYGDIEILTASELGANLFRRIGRPIRFKTAMLNAKERLETGQASGGKRQELDVPALIAQLDGLRKQGVLTEEEFQKKKAELLTKL